MGIDEDLEDLIKNDLQYIFSVNVIFESWFYKRKYKFFKSKNIY